MDVLLALGQTALVTLAGWFVLGRAGSQPRWAALLLVLCTLDLAAAHRWMVPTAPSSIWQRDASRAALIVDGPKAGEGSAALRTIRSST